jgi:hypothetical protein
MSICIHHLKFGRIEGFVLFPHKKCIETMWKTLHHTYYVEVEFVQFFQSMSLIHLWHIIHVEVV